MGIVRGLLTATAGSGPPVLVMRGDMGPDHRYFRPWLDTLGSASTLAYDDQRGNGRPDEVIAPVSEGAGRLADGLPQAGLVVFEGSGHVAFVEEPERAAQMASAWLARQIQGA